MALDLGAAPHGVFYYEAHAGDRVRIAISHRNEWRHIFWIRVSRGGDIYCTFGHGEHLETGQTGSTVTEDGTLTIEYDDPDLRTVEGPLKGGRVSFHASGQINLGDQELRGTSLSERAEHEMLCTMVFEHPANFPPLGIVGQRDILLQLRIAEDRALVGAVHFEPPGGVVKLDPGVRELGIPRRHLVIRFAGLTAPEASELTVRVVLGLGPRVEAWPPKSYVIAPFPRVGSDADRE